MVLLIDNYDSFSYNLEQLAGSIRTDIQVIRNDAIKAEEIANWEIDHIILSPGPGYPKDAGICEEIVIRYQKTIPILGVCLGHQAICEALGGKIVHAKKLMHGKAGKVTLDLSCPIFYGLDKEITVARYHSLAASSDTLPDTLCVTARDKDGEIMAVAHKKWPVYGLQFHPESILTKDGKRMMENFLKVM